MKIAVYPGSFDPLTNGHLDLIERAAHIFDQVIVAVAHNEGKRTVFTVAERLAMIVQSCAHLPRVQATAFEGLTAHFVRAVGATAIVRGLRAVSDFEFELQMALMNKQLNPHCETVFMMTALEWSFLSSSIVKEIASFGGDITPLVPPPVAARLREKFGGVDAEEGRAVP